MTRIMVTVSKSQFKAKALEYFRQVESTGREIIITDRGNPTVKIAPFREEPSEILCQIRDSAVGEGEWEAGKERDSA